jgi:CheY-like chemotaxis protein
MKSTKELLRKIHDPNLSPTERAVLCCQLAKHLEEIGNYEAGCEALEEFWSGIGERPKVEKLEDEKVKAEVVMRAGSLTGWLGSIRQIEGSQEAAKNLITESIGIFESLNEVKKVAEAQTEIAVCYRRENMLDNARVVLSQALARLDDEDGDLKRLALLRSAVIEKLAKQFEDALNIFMSAAPLFETTTNHTLKGRFHNEFAIVLENLGAIQNSVEYLDRALIEYTASSFHFDQAGHSRYQACVENNLAMLYLKVKRVADAHEHLDRAQALFTRLNDNIHLGQVEETRARAWLAEDAFAKAEKSARAAVTMLASGDEPSLLTDALITHGITLSHLNENDEAKAAFERAIQVSELAGDLESAGLAAIALIEQLGQRFPDEELCVIIERARELLKDNSNPAIRDRLLECAFYVLSLVGTVHFDWTNYSFDRSVHRYEARQIRRALEDAGGVISKAARLLGLTHQRLHKILKNRHKNLRELLAEIIGSGQESGSDTDAISDLDQGSNEATQPIRILHVEDDPTIAGLVQEISEHEGWKVEHCIDGTTALKELASDRDYDILLVDYQLPGMNGLELVRQARSMVHRQDLRIIMLSGTLHEAEAREAGADAFLRKPQDIGSIVEIVNRLVGEHEQEP